MNELGKVSKASSRRWAPTTALEINHETLTRPPPLLLGSEKVNAFYRPMAKSPVDIVTLGRNGVSRRHLLRLDTGFEVRGKLSRCWQGSGALTQTLIESPRVDLKPAPKITANPQFRVEANDMGQCAAGNRCALRGRPPPLISTTR